MARTKKLEIEEEEFELDLASAEVIPAKVDLRPKAKERKVAQAEKDPVKAAEAALKRMERTFVVWIAEESDRLLQAMIECDRAGYAKEERDLLFRTAHDIKGQAATLGYPLAGRVAASLCLLLDLVADANQLPRELVRQHVLAIRAIVNEDARDEKNEVARRLADRLDEVTGDYLSAVGAI